MLLLDRILTLIVNRISNTSYHLQYLYCQGGNATGAKPNLITCVTEIFLSVGGRNASSGKFFRVEKIINIVFLAFLCSYSTPQNCY